MTDLTWLDRAIGWLSPQRGAGRAQARAVMDALLSYEGAKSGRRTDGWITTGTSADAEVMAALGPMRNRARDLERNNAHAAKGVSVIVSNKIGTGIMAQAAGPNQRVNKRVNERWKRWVDRCDITGKTDLYGMQSGIERTRCVAGEALIRKIQMPRLESDDDIPIRLQLLEPDFIDESRNSNADTGNQIRHGIEYNRYNAPVAYYLFDTHPGDNSGASLRRGFESSRIPADQIIHYYKPLRPGQTRGVTDFAPVMILLRDLDDWNGAKMMRAKISACSVGAVTTPAGLPASSMGPATLNTNAEGAKHVERFEPGQFHYFKPGEMVNFFDPKPLDDSAFVNDELHAVAAGMGIPYELLSGNLSDVNYSSGRLGLVQFKAMVEADQWQVTVPQVCDPICRWFTTEVVAFDKSVDPNMHWVHTPPRFGLFDPAKEIPPMVESLQAGIESYPNMQRREGYDWREKLLEIKECNEELDRLGLKLTSDARTKIAPAAAPEPKPEAKPAEAA